MHEYDIKKTHQKNIDLGKLENIIRENFGAVKNENGKLIASFGGLAELTTWLVGNGKLAVETKMNPKVSEEIAADTVKRYNAFLFAATGFTAKERAKKAKKGN
jgi:hypothetical protein